jgi:hypothetical protein
MRLRLLLALIASLTFFLSCSNSTDSNDDFVAGHFDFVLYDGLSTSDISSISTALRKNYTRILNDLQVESMPKVTGKIWADYNNFLQAMEDDIGTRYNGATGYVFGLSEFRMYFTGDVALTAVHEFTHVVSLNVNHTIANNPRWLWEAVALYETGDFVDPKTLPYMVSGDYPTLAKLNTDYNGSNHYIYSVGYVLLEYIVVTWGMDTAIDLIKNNGDIYGLLGITAQEFELGWYQFIEQKYLQNQ